MANLIDKQIVEEGYRNAVIKVTGVLDTSDINLVSFIKPSDFVTNDAMAGVLSGFRFDAVMYSMGQQLDMALYWNGGTPQEITPLARSGKIDATGDGGFLPDTQRSGYDGSINIKSTGYVPGTVQNFTLLIRLVKLYK